MFTITLCTLRVPFLFSPLIYHMNFFKEIVTHNRPIKFFYKPTLLTMHNLIVLLNVIIAVQSVLVFNIRNAVE